MILGEKMVIGQMAISIARILSFQSVEKEHFVRAFVLGLDGAARLQFEQPLDMSGHGLGYVDPAGNAEGFHEPRGVDRIAPDVEGHPAATDDTGNDWTGMDADSQLRGIFSEPFTPGLEAIDVSSHLQRRQANVDRVLSIG